MHGAGAGAGFWHDGQLGLLHGFSKEHVAVHLGSEHGFGCGFGAGAGLTCCLTTLTTTGLTSTGVGFDLAITFGLKLTVDG